MRVIVVHDTDHVKAVLAAALEMRRKPVLQTAPKAVMNEGIVRLKKMVELGAAFFPTVSYQLILDCGDDTAVALSALRTGYKYIRLRFHGAHEMRKILYDEAGKEKAEIISGLCEALDMASHHNPIAAARTWLEGAA